MAELLFVVVIVLILLRFLLPMAMVFWAMHFAAHPPQRHPAEANPVIVVFPAEGDKR